MIIGLASRFARADAIPTVKMSSSGPDQSIPSKQSFYVAGDVEATTTGVQAVVVRKGSAMMFGGDGESCPKLATSLDIDSPKPDPLPAGRYDAGQEFPAAESSRDLKTLVTAQWTPSSSTDTTYRVLVPYDDDFFRDGYSYCLFVLVTKKTQKVDTDSIQNAIDQFVTKYQDCKEDLATPRDKDAPPTECQQEALKLYDQCVEALLAKAVLDDDDKAKKEKRKALRDKASTALGTALAIRQQRAKIVADLNFAVHDFVAAPTHEWRTADHGLGHALVTLLTDHGSLFRGVSGGALHHYTNDGKIDVQSVAILDDNRHVRVGEKEPTAAKALVLDDVSASDLPVATGVTLADIFDLSRAIITVDKHAVKLADLRSKVRDTDLAHAWTAEQTAELVADSEQLYKVAAAIDDMTATFDAQTKKAAEASQNAAPAPVDQAKKHAKGKPPAGPAIPPVAAETHAATMSAIGEWLDETHDQHLSIEVLDNLSTELRSFVVQKPKWDGERKDLAFLSEEKVTVTGPQPIAFQVGFNEQTWVFSYVTPTVGYAQVDSHDGWFSLFYLAAEIHLWPNPVNAPMWRHGVDNADDWKRMFALELGFAPNVSSFGPDGRYSGILGLPPPFVGLAVHPLPYTSLTAGMVYLDRKETVLAAERPSHVTDFFIGLNVQFNIPDLIRQSTQQNAPTSVEKN
ncbi:MAG TPA: hypothetical protein VL463_29415 [Kofleriaceae bacterium]|nr:hypothetical protein [Kofleriaceae bacterium]